MSKKDVKCQFCETQSKFDKMLMRCAEPSCKIHFHGECGRINGIQMSVTESKSVYCK